MSKLSIEKLLKRNRTYIGIYADVGTITDQYTTQELFNFTLENFNMDTALRYYLEQQIVAYIRNLENSV